MVNEDNSEIFCSECGEEIERRAEICPYCGYEGVSMGSESIRLENRRLIGTDADPIPDVEIEREFHMDSVRVVQFASDAPQSMPDGRNIMGFIQDGIRLWTIEIPEYEGDLTHRKDPDGRVRCISWKNEYELDPQTGEVNHLNMHR